MKKSISVAPDRTKSAELAIKIDSATPVESVITAVWVKNPPTPIHVDISGSIGFPSSST
mgnify:CR=1 FL=1